MAKKVYEMFKREQVTDDMLQEASKLFSENYGIWGKNAATIMGAFAKEGTHVKMSKDRLRAQYLPTDIPCSYIRVTVDGKFAGNVFACYWTYKSQSVCWITQLVVHRDYRERGLASGLLSELRQKEDNIYGVISSHPAACLATIKALGSALDPPKLDYIRDHAKAIINSSPIDYVKGAKPCGILFDSKDASGLVSSAFTNFYVNHAEPLEALSWVRENIEWPLGDLIDGHEFLLILEVRRRARSVSRH